MFACFNFVARRIAVSSAMAKRLRGQSCAPDVATKRPRAGTVAAELEEAAVAADSDSVQLAFRWLLDSPAEPLPARIQQAMIGYPAKDLHDADTLLLALAVRGIPRGRGALLPDVAKLCALPDATVLRLADACSLALEVRSTGRGSDTAWLMNSRLVAAGTHAQIAVRGWSRAERGGKGGA